MASNLAPTVLLNNYFQRRGQGGSGLISYLEQDHGPTVENRWTITVKINGQEMGRASAPRRNVAKENAAAQALHMLEQHKEAP